ncbi:IS5 family transposase [Christensenellaceae bacterium OttesenSCG-928-L17]|nr:IS5 family transposase [Christensenellaceae bacterium OttesenSCG-928-L17]
MEITKEQYQKIEPYLPVQRGNVRISNLQTINAILYMTENGCKWRALPEKYGNWHTIYMRMNRWSKNGVLQRLFEGLQREDIIKIRMEAVCIDSTTVKVHPDGTGALKKPGQQSIGRSRGGLTTKIHMVTASDRSAIVFSLSPGNAHDAPEGRLLLSRMKRGKEQRYLLMDRAYEGQENRKQAVEMGFVPIVPPKKSRKDTWGYDKERYKQRNEIERYFLRLKRFRRIFTRYDKLDTLFAGFILFAMIADALLSVHTL